VSVSASSARPAAPAQVRPLTPQEAAWLAVVPCAALAAGAMLLLARPLGDALFPPGAETFWPSVVRAPEPAEHVRYFIALLAWPLLAAVVVAAARRRIVLRAAAIDALVLGAQALLVVFAAICFVRQQTAVWPQQPQPDRLFTPPTLAAAALAAAVAALLLRSDASRRAYAWAVRARPGLAAGCAAVAALLSAVWLLTGVNSDGTIGYALANHLIAWDLDEGYAVLNGLTPLVDFHAQYGQVEPYFAAVVVALAGSSLGVLTVTMATLSGLALLGVYAVFRRLLGAPLLALALFVPFLATTFFVEIQPFPHRLGRLSPAGMFSLWPLRYGGAYLMLWLTARHLDGAAPRRGWALLLAAAAVAVNNLEFGGAAFVATLAALLLHDASARAWRTTRRRLCDLLVGVAGALALVTLLALAHSGELPRLDLLFEFPRLYVRGGWVLVPMVAIGVHLVVYATFVSAGVVAVVRAVRREDPLLTSLLAWSAAFGLLAGGYFVGRSDPLNLIAIFSAWALALSLLLIVVVRSLASAQGRRPSPAELAVLFGFGLMLCSIVQVPPPWREVERLRQEAAIPQYQSPALKRFVAGETEPGAKVALLVPMGHRVAYELGRRNVAPYASVESMPTLQQVRRTAAVLRHDGVTRVFLGMQDVTPGIILPDVVRAFQRLGYTVRDLQASTYELDDTASGG
jgi:hypothetical protein